LKKVKPILSPDELTRLIGAAADWNPKYNMLLRLGFETGLRISDILRLKPCMIKDQTLILTEKKTGKTRVIKLDTGFSRYLKNYARRYRLSKTDYYIFRYPKDKDKPLSRIRAWALIKTIAKEQGLEDIGTHTMRKTFAVNLYNQTGSLEKVREALNHSTEEITKKYLKT